MFAIAVAARSGVERATLAVALLLLFADVFVDPLQDHVSDLKIVLVEHHHMTVALDANIWKEDDLHVATRCVDARSECPTIGK